MSSKEELNQYVIADTNLAQETQSEIKVEVDEVKPDGVETPHAAIVVGGGAVGFIMIWAGFLLVLSKIRTLREDNKIVFPVNHLNKLPCKTCRYFSNNHYVQCAVQPSIVLTEEAMNCSDYCPKHDKSSKSS